MADDCWQVLNVSSKGFSGIRVLRAFRVLRLFKVFKYIKVTSLQQGFEDMDNSSQENTQQLHASGMIFAVICLHYILAYPGYMNMSWLQVGISLTPLLAAELTQDHPGAARISSLLPGHFQPHPTVPDCFCHHWAPCLWRHSAEQ